MYYLVIGFFALLLFVLTLYFGSLYTLLATVVLISLFFAYLIYQNKRYLRYNWIMMLTIYLTTALFVVSVDYVFNSVFEQRHRDRFNILLGKDVDDQGIGYNTAQSVITIGSGGVTE